MSDLPQLIASDIDALETTLSSLLDRTEAKAAILTDRAGFVIALFGSTEALDTTTLGALAANSYAASAAMAGMIGEPDFNSLYQEGSLHSLLVNALGDNALLVVIFDAHVSGGAVKYYATIAGRALSAHLDSACARAPGETIDFATLNVADSADFFRRKA